MRLLDLAAEHTDVVIGVVSKIDVHRNWREVLAADSARLAAHAARYREVPWVGVAAAPDLGEPNVDELVELLRSRLAESDVERRNRLRAWESRLQTAISRQVNGRRRRRSAGAGRRHCGSDGNAVLRRRRMAKSERTIALRSQIQQARVQLSYFARNRCTSVRSELQEDASGMTRRGCRSSKPTSAPASVRWSARWRRYHPAPRRRRAELQLTAPEPPLPPPPPAVPEPPLKSRRLETRLMMVLGAGFGLGVALT